jgi:hypothetical protein
MKEERYRLILMRKEISPGCVVEYEADSSSHRVGVILPETKILRAAASPGQKAQVRAWRAIQAERRRQGLPPLTPEEMPIEP